VRDKSGARKAVPFVQVLSQVPELPEPGPLRGVRVLAALRGDPPALRQGGARRAALVRPPEDFRTEVLGLVKAQQVKNVVIVPVGSKGGFVLKAAPPMGDREAYLKEGVACYQKLPAAACSTSPTIWFRQGRAAEDVGAPRCRRPVPRGRRDKGTATFSITPTRWRRNTASGSGTRSPRRQRGYDHKKMGITAKGAWESVKRHFREMGVDTQTQDFTVAGIGDMSGDVFGNGMLLSRTSAGRGVRPPPRLPRPHARSRGHVRRARSACSLCRARRGTTTTSRSSRRAAASSRAAPSRSRLTEAAGGARHRAGETRRRRTCCARSSRRPWTLLYNGGIGTYVKASRQANGEVGDRANNEIRINGADLRCKVVGEGGNLGFTQLGRVEFAQRGGRIYTDAIDNSAGVDCSDHEVNIKILTGLVMSDGEMTLKQRNKLLAEMTDDVGRLVLADNYYQPQSLAVSGRARREAARLPGRIHARPREGGPAQPRRGVPALRRRDRRAPRREAGPDGPRARGAARVLQDAALRRTSSAAASWTTPTSPRRSSATSRPCCASATPRTCSAIA
jgi:glutamate dehydrogenase